MIFILSHKQNVHDARTEQHTGNSSEMVEWNARHYGETEDCRPRERERVETVA